MSSTMRNTVSFLIKGDVGDGRFRGWIINHSNKLGVSIVAMRLTKPGLRVDAIGAHEMLDALMVACLLGPSCVMVTDVVPLEA